jgi:hypothetical protein
MVEGQKGELHGVDVVESVSEIDFNCFDLTTSNIVGSNLDVESMAIGNLAFWSCGNNNKGCETYNYKSSSYIVETSPWFIHLIRFFRY